MKGYNRRPRTGKQLFPQPGQAPLPKDAGIIRQQATPAMVAPLGYAVKAMFQAAINPMRRAERKLAQRPLEASLRTLAKRNLLATTPLMLFSAGQVISRQMSGVKVSLQNPNIPNVITMTPYNVQPETGYLLPKFMHGGITAFQAAWNEAIESRLHFELPFVLALTSPIWGTLASNSFGRLSENPRAPAALRRFSAKLRMTPYEWARNGTIGVWSAAIIKEAYDAIRFDAVRESLLSHPWGYGFNPLKVASASDIAFATAGLGAGFLASAALLIGGKALIRAHPHLGERMRIWTAMKIQNSRVAMALRNAAAKRRSGRNA